ncbi:MAG: hypothetical protein V1894_01370 [Chloroflexota bacterium]
MSWKRILRLFEWAFGLMLLVTLGVTGVLPLLSSFSKWVFVAGLCLYAVASALRIGEDSKNLK